MGKVVIDAKDFSFKYRDTKHKALNKVNFQDALNIKEREQRQRLGEADLKAQRPVRERAERPGQHAVQRGDDPRAAEHLGGKPLHDSVTSVVFR